MSATTVPSEFLRNYAERGLGGMSTTGLGSGQVSLSGLSGSQTAVNAGQDWNTFMSDWGPLIEKQVASLNSNDMVAKATEDAARVPGQMTAATDRAAARRGGYTGSQVAGLAAARELGGAAQSANIMNNARIDQRERNFTAAMGLSGIGTNIYQMGMDNLRESEGLSAQRRMNNASAAAAAKSNNMSMAVTAAATIAMIA